MTDKLTHDECTELSTATALLLFHCCIGGGKVSLEVAEMIDERVKSLMDEVYEYRNKDGWPEHLKPNESPTPSGSRIDGSTRIGEGRDG